MVMDSSDDWRPIAIAPEGLRTNGKYLVRFKRGAFASLLPVTPALLRYDYSKVNPTTEPCGFGIGWLIFAELLPTTVTIDSYAPLIPNDYLFNEYAKKIPGG